MLAVLHAPCVSEFVLLYQQKKIQVNMGDHHVISKEAV